VAESISDERARSPRAGLVIPRVPFVVDFMPPCIDVMLPRSDFVLACSDFKQKSISRAVSFFA